MEKKKTRILNRFGPKKKVKILLYGEEGIFSSYLGRFPVVGVQKEENRKGKGKKGRKKKVIK